MAKVISEVKEAHKDNMALDMAWGRMTQKIASFGGNYKEAREEAAVYYHVNPDDLMRYARKVVNKK